MTDLRLLTGAEAFVEAMRQIDPDVVPVYPITPQTPMIEGFAKVVADGRAHAEIVNVESEHSAMSAAVGSALAGARTITATSSQGLALMAEIVYIAASLRAPIVMGVGNRALSGPINIHCDHSDSMLIRDSGVAQLFVQDAQEAYDFTLIATRLAERRDVLLPVLVCQDGFTVTHTSEPVDLLPDEAARAFVGEYRLERPLLDVRRPVTEGGFAMPDEYFELRHEQGAAIEAALPGFADVAAEFAALSGRAYGVVEPYELDDADRAIVLLGASAGTVKDVVDDLRAEGERVGLLTIRAFRPFPVDAVRAALAGLERAIVLDRAASPGGAPPLYAELAGALYGSGVPLDSHVYGLGGRDLLPEHVRAVFHGDAARYVGLREA
jgi:pyruvate ferredoxin oxidoreductase alpha subunit